MKNKIIRKSKKWKKSKIRYYLAVFLLLVLSACSSLAELEGTADALQLQRHLDFLENTLFSAYVTIDEGCLIVDVVAYESEWKISHLVLF